MSHLLEGLWGKDAEKLGTFFNPLKATTSNDYYRIQRHFLKPFDEINKKKSSSLRWFGKFLFTTILV